jgi:DNA-binding transcriptional LysR family regulator
VDEGAWRKARRQVIQLNQYDQVIQAALAGQGLAIGRIELLQPLIDSKQLAIVDIPCTPVRSAYSFWLLRAEDEPREDVRQVAQWICEEAGRVREWRCEQLAPYGARAAA